jgi:hypothetical protein
MQHDGSAYLSTKRAIESAEDRGFDLGREYGIQLGLRLAVEWLERKHEQALADELRGAEQVERTEG